MLMGIARLEEDRGAADRLAEQMRIGISQLAGSPLQGHVEAMFLATLAGHEVWCGRLPSAAALLTEAFQAAVRTRDMPIVSSVALSGVALVQASGDSVTAAGMLGAAAALRGSDDATDLTVRRLTASLRSSLGERFEPTYAAGRALSRDDALARLDPAAYMVEAATG
jgi:hypothetical protein